MWMSSRGLAKYALPVIVLFALVAVVAAFGVVWSVDNGTLAEASQPYINGTDIEVHRVYDRRTGICFVAVIDTGAFQTPCTPEFKNLASTIDERTYMTVHTGRLASLK